MRTNDFHRSLASLFIELTQGVAKDGLAFMLNPGDPGLLGSLDRLSADVASAAVNDGATIAAHVAHLSYGLSLLNRWAAGETDPFAAADWTMAWQTTSVNDEQWRALRRQLNDEVSDWLAALKSEREVSGIELDGVVGSVIHLAYHLGAIRQISAAARGPRATD